jgi:hypothetical protein
MIVYITIIVSLLALTVGLIFEVVFYSVCNGYSEIGPWAFRRRADGTFSPWQIVAQFLLIVPASIFCLLALGYALVQFVKLFIAEIHR